MRFDNHDTRVTARRVAFGIGKVVVVGEHDPILFGRKSHDIAVGDPRGNTPDARALTTQEDDDFPSDVLVGQKTPGGRVSQGGWVA